MSSKTKRILELCAEIECLCDSRNINGANFKIIELLGVVAGKSKYSVDIEKTIWYYFDKAENYTMQEIR